MSTRNLPGSFTLSTALVATMAVVVIAFTSPAQAAPATVTIHAAPSAAQLRQLAPDVQGRDMLADSRMTFDFVAGPDGRALGVNVAVSPAQPR